MCVLGEAMPWKRTEGQAGKPRHEGRRLEASQLIVERFPMSAIREKSIENLKRWRSQGTWNRAYGEWLQLMLVGSDAEIVAVMTGEDQNAVRLRASMPYVGLLDKETVWSLKQKWSDGDLDARPELKEAFLNGRV